MNDDPENNLEQEIGRALRQLPLRRAPATLLPRVLAAIQAHAHQPWWQRPLATWPRWMQVITLVLSVGIASLLAWGIGQGIQAVDFAAAGKAVGSFLDRFEFVWTATTATGNAFLLVLSKTHPIFLCAAGALCVIAYTSCVGMGTLLYRLATNKP